MVVVQMASWLETYVAAAAACVWAFERWQRRRH